MSALDFIEYIAQNKPMGPNNKYIHQYNLNLACGKDLENISIEICLKLKSISVDCIRDTIYRTTIREELYPSPYNFHASSELYV